MQKLFDLNYRTVGSLKELDAKAYTDNRYIKEKLFPGEDELSNKAAKALHQFLGNQFLEDIDYNFEQGLTNDFETSSDEGLAGCLGDLLQRKAKWGDAAFRDAALTILNEDTGAEEVYNYPSIIDSNVPIVAANVDMPLDEIYLGDRQREMIAHLKHRGIRTTTDLFNTQREQYPADAGNLIEFALQLFTMRFVSLDIVEFNKENKAADTSLHRRLTKAGHTVVWDLTQTTEGQLHHYLNIDEMQRVKTTLKKEYGILNFKSEPSAKSPIHKKTTDGGHGGMR